jgi:hypothetical protein
MIRIRLVIPAMKKTKTKPKQRNFRKLATNHVIEHFGGISGTARALGMAPQTVHYWIEIGRIPEEHAKPVAAAMRSSCADIVRLATEGNTLRL